MRAVLICSRCALGDRLPGDGDRGAARLDAQRAAGDRGLDAATMEDDALCARLANRHARGGSMQKWERMLRLWQLLHKGSYTARGLACMCGVHVRTIQRDLADMTRSELHIGLTCEGTRYRIM